jgi:Tol biopolymer transport system component
LTNERALTTDAHVNWGPSWHPKGHHVIFASSAVAHTNYELFLMRGDGKKKLRITFAPGADILPVFSPDGRYLMWTSQRTTDKTSQLFIARFKMPAAG